MLWVLMFKKSQSCAKKVGETLVYQQGTDLTFIESQIQEVKKIFAPCLKNHKCHSEYLPYGLPLLQCSTCALH